MANKRLKDRSERYCYNADCQFFGVGEGGEGNQKDAIKNYLASADMKNGKARMVLGHIHEQGLGVK